MLSNPETKPCVDSKVVFCVFVLSARAETVELERRLAGLSSLSGQATNTGGCDFTLERKLLRSSASQFLRMQFFGQSARAGCCELERRSRIQIPI